MKRSRPITSRAAASACPGWLTPIQQFWWKYSVADLGRMCSSAKRNSPIAPRLRMLPSIESRCSSVGGTHAQPISVIANLSFGKRSNTPDHSRNHSGRDVHQTVSLAYRPSTPGTAP